MSNALRDKIAEVVWSGTGGNDVTQAGRITDAIIAALPGVVLPLQWGEVQWGQDEFGCQQWGEFIDHLTSMSKCECYAIYRFEDGKFMWTQGDHDNMRYSTYRPMFDPDWVPAIPWHPTEKAAQSAAQAHHVAQIMTAFGIDAGAMREAFD